jgi:S-adenosylmethionine:tRNA ribosyltransferase-isomerase
MRVADFDYELPDSAIAQAAIEPRDASRLLDTSTMTDRTFSDLPSLLDAGDLLVVNETKVRAARLVGTRPTGGSAEVLLTNRIDPDRWQALVRPSRRMKTGSVVTIGEDVTVRLLSDPIDGVATVTVVADGDVEEAIDRTGRLPLPPYFHGTLNSDDRYQTVFAQRVGSSAAPTAALHFTDSLLDRIDQRGVEIAKVNLEVGLDTFRPMDRGATDAALVADHRIHTERVTVPAAAVDAVARVRHRRGRVIAVGTTVVRSLESAALGLEDPDSGLIAEYDGPTDLFITPGFRPRVIDGLITNFHAPGTTLLVLIAALVGPRWRTIYEHALTNGYRFLSFGDAMMIGVDR